MTSTQETALPSPPRPSRRILATVLGNALEFYDFTAYAFFAAPIGQAFFPGGSPFDRLMLSLAAFGVGFVTRPVGAVVIGRYGDRAGRRPAMVLSFGLMGLSMLVMALTPPLARIGLLAPVIIVAARLLQGFALGGDLGPTTAYLMEAAPPGRRGWFGAWQAASQGLAVFLAGVVGLTLSVVLKPVDLHDWGWRIAFLLGASSLPVGLMLRRALPETLHEPEESAGTSAPAARGADHRRMLILGFLIVVSATTLTYALTYMTTYASAILRLPDRTAFAATVLGGLCGVVFCPLGGVLSDRLGRRPLMIWPRVLILLGAYPAFQLIFRGRDPVTLLAATGSLAALGALSSGPAMVWLSEMLPRRGRSTGVATLYAAAVVLFGGTTQMVLTWLIHVTGDVRAPAGYLVVTSGVGILAAWMASETLPARALPVT